MPTMTTRAGPYPLGALERLRREIRERRERELGAAQRALDEAERELAARREAHAAARRQLEAERARLAREPATRGLELERAERYLERLAARLEERARDERAAEERRALEERACAGARAALGLAQAELEALEKHHAGWDRARRELEERRAEQELEDLTAARRRERGG